jgi:hypothetical protein
MATMMDEWKNQTPVLRKCQYCKQVKDCRQGPDPYLLNVFDETEIVWLCDACYDLREYGDHLEEHEGEAAA